MSDTNDEKVIGMSRDEKYDEEILAETETEEPLGVETAEEGDEEEVVSDPLTILELKVKELEDENSSLKEQYLRKQADFENFRKRMFREREDAVKYANATLLSDVIQVIDNFERAIQSSKESKDFDSFFTGIELIEKQFTSMLERNWGLKRFESIGTVFDPEKHEAIAMDVDDRKEEQIVLEDFQKGYMLHERVLRHAKVKISAPPGNTSNGDDDEKNQEQE